MNGMRRTNVAGWNHRRHQNKYKKCLLYSFEIMDNITIRKIQLKDNKELASIIRSSLKEFGANKPGTVFFDDTTDHLYQLFQQPGSMSFVIENNGKLLGGARIYPS